MSQPISPGEAPWRIGRREPLPAPRDVVWRLLTEPAEIARWLAPRAEVRLDAPPLRYAFFGPTVFGTRDRSDDEIAARAENFAVLACEPEALLVFRWWVGDSPTTVRFELHDHLGGTDLRVAQWADEAIDWPASPDEPNWWWIHLAALRSVLETGTADLLVDWESLPGSSELAFALPISTFPWIIWSKLVVAEELSRWAGKETKVDLDEGIYRYQSHAGQPRGKLEHVPEERLVLDWQWPDGRATRREWTIRETDEDTIVRLADLGPWNAADRVTVERVAASLATTLIALREISQRGITPREHEWEP
ncbi:MAG TPA: SRPBCC domain-containing protein [Planctomycetota bacterium]|nr:SRPBCC domain-containing protein [Planctomycetota bacterium]